LDFLDFASFRNYNILFLRLRAVSLCESDTLRDETCVEQGYLDKKKPANLRNKTVQHNFPVLPSCPSTNPQTSPLLLVLVVTNRRLPEPRERFAPFDIHSQFLRISTESFYVELHLHLDSIVVCRSVLWSGRSGSTEE